MAAILAALAGAGAAAAADYYKTAGNLSVYLGVLPAKMALGHSPEHPEGKMHGGVPSDKRQHHVVTAIFDARDGKRITDAEVTAGVGEIGRARAQKKLERMVIDNTISYGSYFSMGGSGQYLIEVDIRRPGSTAPVSASFRYSHPRR